MNGRKTAEFSPERRNNQVNGRKTAEFSPEWQENQVDGRKTAEFSPERRNNQVNGRKTAEFSPDRAKIPVALQHGILLCPRYLDTLSMGIFPTDASAKWLVTS